jgi:excisionase family DNA binding protein
MEHNLQITLETLPHHFIKFIRDFESFKESYRQAPQEVEQPVDVDAAKEFLNLENVQTVYRMVREGRVPFHKKGSRLYFFKSELNAWIKSEKELLTH